MSCPHDWFRDGHVTQFGPMRVSLQSCAETIKKEILSFQWIECKPGVASGIFATTSGEPVRQCSHTEESRTKRFLALSFVYLDPNNLKATNPALFSFT